MKPCKRCGEKPRITPFPGNGFYVHCGSCWSGPVGETKQEAEAAWDELMGGETLTAEPEPRRPVAAMFAPHSMIWQGALVVVCDDGTVWSNSDERTWCAFPSIPGTIADRSGDE
ncbi:MAG: hypothetical protein WC373_12875 [Smithella sp.]|jgi:hypothetical protein